MNLFELFVKIGVDDQASSKISTITQKLGVGLKTAASVGIAAVSAVSSGIMALGTYATKVGSDFEAQMSKVSAISGATGQDLQDLTDKAKQMGIDTKFSATEAGQAFEYMAMAGWKTEQMLDGISGIMDLAAASGESLASVSDIVTDALTAFGLSAEDSTHFADVLAAASSNANTNVAMMGDTFKYVAPVAGAMGYSIEDTATVIGLMANAGIKASQAGTSLRQMLTRLSDATFSNTEYFAALNAEIEATAGSISFMDKVSMSTGSGITELDAVLGFLGITASNSDGSMRSLSDIMLNVKEAMSTLTQEEQAYAAKIIAGQEAMSGLLAIINTSEEEYNKLAEAINNADGASKAMADTMANNLQGEFTLLKSSAEGFGIALYEHLQSPLTDMVSWAVDGLNALTNAFKTHGIEGAVDAAGSLLSEFINEIVNGAPKLVDLATKVIESFVNGIGENSDTIANGAVSIIFTLTDGLINLLPNITAVALDLIIALATGIADALPELTPTIIDVILKIVEVLTDPAMLNNLLEAALSIVLELGHFIADSIPVLMDAAVKIIENLISFISDPDTLRNLAIAALEIIKQLAFGIVDAIPALIDATFTIIDNIVTMLTDPSTLPMLFEAAFTIVTSLGLGLIEAVPKLIQSAEQLIEKFVKKFIEFDWVQLGKDILAGIGNGLKAGYEFVSDKIGGAVDWIFDLFKKETDSHSPSRRSAREVGKPLMQGVAVGFEDGAYAAKSSMVSTLRDVGETIATTASSIGTTIADAFSSSLSSGMSSGVAGAMSGVLGNLTDKPWSTSDFLAGFGIDASTVDTSKVTLNGVPLDQMMDGVSVVSIPMDVEKLKAEGYHVYTDENGNVYFSDNSLEHPSMRTTSKFGKSVNITQNIYSEAKTAADLMEEALYQQQKAVTMGV